MEIVGNDIRLALAASEVTPDLAHQLSLVARALPPQSIAFDILIEQFVRVDLRGLGQKELQQVGRSRLWAIPKGHS